MAADIAKRLGIAVRHRREQLGLSQEAVAGVLGKSQAWLSYLEAGKRNPRLEDLDELLRELDLILEIKVSRWHGR